MHKQRKNTLIDLAITALFMLLTYWVHTETFINWDVAWHVEGARRLLSGGSYLVNVFDNNSPFVFSYFFPAVWLHRILFLPYPSLIVGYITITTIIPLALSYQIINQALGDENEEIVKRLIYYALVFIVLFLPGFNFGHREIVLIYFYLPYFLLLMFSTTYSKTVQIRTYLYYLTAVLAAYGIAQNILYLSIPIFIDLYRFMKLRKFKGYQTLFYCCIIFNISLVSFLYPEYIRYIIPMVLCYESGFNFPVLALLLEVLTFISLLTVIIVLINFKKLYKSDDIIICFIAAVCSLLIYFFELKLWYYHLYPALCFVMLILILFIAKYYEETALGTRIVPRINLFNACAACGILVTIFVVILGFARTEFKIFHNPNDVNHRWLVIPLSWISN